MRVSLPTSLLVISIDLELDAAQRADRSRQEALAGATSRLVELFSRFEVPATWGAAHPATSHLTHQLLDSHVPHDVAILADEAWVGQATGRGVLARELMHRASRARQAQVSVSTLSLHDCELDGNFDLLIKHGINAIRGNSHSLVSGHASPRVLRHGLREFPVSLRLPGTGGLVSRYQAGRHATGRIQRIVREGGHCHLLIDAARLAEVGSVRQIERLLRRAANHRQRGLLVVETVAQIAARFSMTRVAPPAKSILRMAA